MILLSPFLFTHWLSMTSLLVLGGEEGAAKSGEWELWGEEEQSQARGLPNLSGERWLSGAGCTGKRRQMESWQVWGIRSLLYTEAMDM